MPGRFAHWLSDSVRFVWALFYWNLRKTLYVRRGRTGRCPCQNESDDSIAGRVRCDAILFWHEPQRFTRVCPLLVRTPDGWKCSVHASQVRPFWGRAMRFGVLSLLTVYLAGTLAVFAGLRITTGVPVGWWHVAWPGAWEEIPRLQSRHMFAQAMESFRRGELKDAHLALTAARLKDQQSYETTLLLAQIEMFQLSFAFADALFAELGQTHPDQILRTAVVYHDTLLGMDRQRELAGHCLVMARSDQSHAAVWIRSALLAIRSMRPTDASELAALLPDHEAGIAEHARRLLHAELDLQAGARDAALARLREPFPGPYNPFYIEYQVERLAELGAGEEAQGLLDRQGPLLGEFDHLRVQTAVAKRAGDAWGARAAFAAILKLKLTAPQLDRLAALLIAQPDRELFRALHERVRRDPALHAQANVAALWITGLVCEARPEAQAWREQSRQPDGKGGLPDIESVDFTRRDVLQGNTAGHLINVVSFPRDVILALLWRTAPKSDPRTRAGGR